jgi:hypothetical protein
MMDAFSRWMAAAAALGLGTSAGCAGTQPPIRARADATGAVEAARAMGAESQPQAALHLQLANEQMAVAERRIADGEMREAERLLRQAEADAAVAISLAREARTRATAEATMTHIQEMRARYL